MRKIRKIIKWILNLVGKVESKYHGLRCFELKFSMFGFDIVGKEFLVENGAYCMKYNLFGFTIYKDNYFENFIKHYRNEIEKYDEIYIVNSSTGEAFLFFAYFMNAYLRGKNMEKILFMPSTKRNLECMNVMAPQIQNILYIENEKYRNMIFDKLNFEKWLFVRLYSPVVYFDVCLRSGYFETLLNHLGLTRADVEYNAPKIDENLISESKRKACIKSEKYVIFMPEANCSSLGNDNLWLELQERLEKMGLEIFWNLVADNENFNCFKTQILSIKELMVLSKNALAVVSLRSGVGEMLESLGGNHFVIYPNIKNEATGITWFDAYHFSQLPNPNNAKFDEYIYKGDNAEQILDDITRKIAALNA